MAAYRNGVSRVFIGFDFTPVKQFLQQRKVIINSQRNTFFFGYLAKKKEHNKIDYEYEVSKDPHEWKFVEKLMPLETVPAVQPKDRYPSGWIPMKEDSLKLPYFVERTKNHMLPVYFKKLEHEEEAVTKISKIHGDLWSLHEELVDHLAEISNTKIISSVHEGNNTILLKGDYVYYTEQWMLSKGF